MRRVLAGLLIAAGVLLLADAGVTLVWQEPLGALREHRTQQRLARDLQRLEAAPLPPEGLAAAARVKGTRRKVAVLARALRPPHGARGGDRAPRRPAPAPPRVVVHGSDLADLARGPGTIDGSPLPGARGTAAIAGHRTTHGAPFGGIDQLRPGDPVTARDALRDPALPRHGQPHRRARRRSASCGAPGTTSSCSSPATRASARPSGSSSSPAWRPCHRTPVRRSSDLFKRTAARPDARTDGTTGRH